MQGHQRIAQWHNVARHLLPGSGPPGLSAKTDGSVQATSQCDAKQNRQPNVTLKEDW